MGCPSPAAPRAAAPRARAGRPASLDRPASMAPPATRTHRIGGARPVCAQVYVVRHISARHARLRRLMPCPRCIRSVGAASSRAILARRHRPRPVLTRAHCAGHHATAESHLVLLWAGPRAVGGVLGAGRGNELREAQQEPDAPSAPGIPGWSRAARHVAAAHGDDVARRAPHCTPRRHCCRGVSGCPDPESAWFTRELEVPSRTRRFLRAETDRHSSARQAV